LVSPYDFDEFRVLKCRDCESSWRSNMYNQDKLDEIYCESDYDLHPYFDRDEGDETTLSQRRFKDYARGLANVGELASGRLLDVGAGSGTFLRIARQAGWQVEGVEMSPKLAQYTSDGGNIPMYVCPFEKIELAPRSLDAITFWDIIEHVVDPRTVIEKTYSLLKPGGAALFCTPNEDSILPRVGRLLYNVGLKYPALALHPTNHTYFFSKKGFRSLLQQSGFEVVKVYSQAAYFEHSPLASKIQKGGIHAIETAASLIDQQYEMVFIASKPHNESSFQEDSK
jgi:2-polyprenyl-3-methyl-5-hydroxy-6-metoxy-1,4-benzoquinol methylase